MLSQTWACYPRDHVDGVNVTAPMDLATQLFPRRCQTAAMIYKERDACRACGTLPAFWQRNAREIRRKLKHLKFETNYQDRQGFNSEAGAWRPSMAGVLIAVLQGTCTESRTTAAQNILSSMYLNRTEQDMLSK